MNLLKKIIISGEIYPCYSKMLFRFDFCSMAEERKSPRYIFSVPEDACITDFQILTEDKILRRAKFTSLTDEKEYCGYKLVELKNGFYCFEWDSIRGKNCTLLVECVTRVKPEKGYVRIMMPVGVQGGGYETVKCDTDITLTLNGMYPEKLDEYECFNKDEKIFSFVGEMNNDFQLICRLEKEENYIISEEELGAGMSFYRIYTENNKHICDYRYAQLFLNLDGLLAEEEIRTTKELFFRVFSAFPDNMPIKIYTTYGKDILDDTYFSTENDRQKIFDILKELGMSSENQKDILEDLYSEWNDETVTIMIANSSADIEKRDEFPIKLFTVGNYKNNLSGYMNNNIHFYQDDINDEHIKNAVERILTDGNYEIVSGGASVSEQLVLGETMQGYMDFIIRYTGKAPREISLLKKGELVNKYLLPKGNAMARQPVVGNLYAMEKSKELYRLLSKASVSSVRAIKKQLTEIGIKYHILNQETILTIQNEEGEKRIDFQPCSASKWQKKRMSGRKTIFGEEKIKVNDELIKIKKLCIESLTNCIRADGGIYPLYCSINDRAEKTAMAVLALLVSGERMVLPAVDDALKYLKEKPDNIWIDGIKAFRNGGGIPFRISEGCPAMDVILDKWNMTSTDFNLSAMLLIRICS